MPLFVAPEDWHEVDDEPGDAIIPRDPVNRVYQGTDPGAVSLSAADEPSALQWYVDRAVAFARGSGRHSTGLRPEAPEWASHLTPPRNSQYPLPCPPPDPSP